MRILAAALAVCLGSGSASAQLTARARAGPPLALPPAEAGVCGQYDDGSTENALGLTAGGEMAWLHYFGCFDYISEVHTAYGTALFPGSVTNGNHSWIFILDDTDANPTNGTTLVASLDTVVTNGDTDILNQHLLAGTVNGPGWIGASADQIAGEFPGPMDGDSSGPEAWVFGNTTGPGTLDIDDLNNNNVPPVSMSGVGFPSYWLLRAVGDVEPGVAYCSCDCVACAPCGNEGAPGNGCGNGTWADGAQLYAGGITNPDSVVLHAVQATPDQPGIFFQGDKRVNGGAGLPFGDGLRCAGTNVVRLEVVFADGAGSADSTVSISIAGGVGPGDVKRYQYWYRDPQLTPCGSGFNVTNGYEITW